MTFSYEILLILSTIKSEPLFQNEQYNASDRKLVWKAILPLTVMAIDPEPLSLARGWLGSIELEQWLGSKYRASIWSDLELLEHRSDPIQALYATEPIWPFNFNARCSNQAARFGSVILFVTRKTHIQLGMSPFPCYIGITWKTLIYLVINLFLRYIAYVRHGTGLGWTGLGPKFSSSAGLTTRLSSI